MPHRRPDQPPPSTGSTEKEVLHDFLSYLRESALTKVAGVPEPQDPHARGGVRNNLLGLIKHLTHVERYVFLGEDVGRWPATFRAGSQESTAEILRAYRDAIEATDTVIDACDDLAEHTPQGTRTKPHPRCGGPSPT